MKSLIAVLCLTAFAAGCTQYGPQPPQVTTGRPYGAYAYTNDYIGPANSPFRTWTTAQLQERRRELYYMVPQTQTPQQVAAYVYHGPSLPQQDEIRAIEGELNRRYAAGDKSAALEPAWPETRRHALPGNIPGQSPIFGE
jgi:hypothetical protein